MVKPRAVKNRNKLDIIYQCLQYCNQYEDNQTMTTTKSRLFLVVGGNVKMFSNLFENVILGPKLIETNMDVEHYAPVYRVTDKGKRFMKTYETLQELMR